MRKTLFMIVAIGVLGALAVGFLFARQRVDVALPGAGESTKRIEPEVGEEGRTGEGDVKKVVKEIFETGGVKHSIPAQEVLSGGPGKDGIPSIDNPKFISTRLADEFLQDDSVGLGFMWKGEPRFYPYQILVWHEIVNDTAQGDPVLITYCPLCGTGVVFERKVNGEERVFGVSGNLWQSNLLMYDRDPRFTEADFFWEVRGGAIDTHDRKPLFGSFFSSRESFWSQVLGEAVVGDATGERLKVLSADTVRYRPWKQAHPSTKVLSRDTGAVRAYGADPYGDYYTNESVSFGAEFSDHRLRPKEFVLGVEINGQFKAYRESALPVGAISDSFAGQELTITKDETGSVRILDGQGENVRIIGGFWFSWVAVHPETELYK